MTSHLQVITFLFTHNFKADTQRIFGEDAKKRRLNEQKVGDFIVDAKLATQFRLTSNFVALEDENFTSKFFAPTYMHLVRLK